MDNGPNTPQVDPSDYGESENSKDAPSLTEEVRQEFDAVAEFTAPVEIAPVQMNGEDDAAPLGDPFHKLPAPPLPRGLMPPILEAFAERETRIKGVEFAAQALAALTVCAAAIPDHITRNRLLLITQLRTFRTELGMTACDPTRKWDERPQLS